MQFYKETKDSVLSYFESSESGLNTDQAQKRISKYGYNELKLEKPLSRLTVFFSQFKSFIIYVLLVAIILSACVGEYLDALIISVILILNAFIGYYQEYSAYKSLKSLEKFNPLNTRVLRNGKIINLNAKYLVPGDIISLQAGDKIPADCRLIYTQNLKVSEAVLTGESISVSKHSEPISQDCQIGDMKNMGFSSTVVVEGLATAVVTSTAADTEIGKISSLLKVTKEDPTPLQDMLNVFGKKLGITIIVICSIIIITLTLKAHLGGNLSLSVFKDIVLISVALVVAAVPEGLPAVVTITLSIGVRRLLKKKALVRKLSSVETLGFCDVICTDKTGTLTRNEMVVLCSWSLDGEANFTGKGYNPEGTVSAKLAPVIYETGISCNNSSIFQKNNEWHITGDPTEAALYVSAVKAGINKPFNALQTIPFDSDRKRMSVLVKKDNQLLTLTKGAPDKILQKCNYALVNNKVETLNNDFKQQIRKQIDSYSSQALRVLAFAYKEIDAKEDFNEDNLIFAGLQAMQDPPRMDVRQSIEKTKNAGIRVIMITGDYKETARAIARDTGIEGQCITGPELEKLTDTELQQALASGCNIFARTIPAHKHRIIAALQSTGAIVAMTGDGVNDAPALKKADIGIAVNSGSDVAKDASDFILIDDSFSHIVNAIEEGRGIFDNIQKSVMFLLSGNLSEVFIIFMAVIFGWNLPLTAIMLLWINLISDGFPALSIAKDPYDISIMQRKPSAMNGYILPASGIHFLLFLGSMATIFILLIFQKYASDSLHLAQTMAFNGLILCELAILFAVRNFFRTHLLTNKWLWITVIMSVLVQAVIIFTPVSELFSITSLSYMQILILFAVAFILYCFGWIYNYLTSNRILKRTR